MLQQGRYQLRITDIAVHKMMACIAIHARQVFAIARIGQLVQADDGFVLNPQPVEHEVGADEAGAACYEDRHWVTASE